MAGRPIKASTPLLMAAAALLLLVPPSHGQARNNNDWLWRQQQQRSQEQMRLMELRRQQEQQRQADLRRQADQRRQADRMQQIQNKRIQDIQQQRLLEMQSKRLQEQVRSATQRAAQAQQAARISAGRPANDNQPKDRLVFSNGIAKLNKPPTTAEMRRGFTGRVTDQGRAIVKVRGKVYVVPASRIGVKWNRPANDNIAVSGGAGGQRPLGPTASAGAGGQRPPGGGGWDWKKQSAITARLQQLASSNASTLAKAKTRVVASGTGSKQPPAENSFKKPANDEFGLNFVDSSRRQLAETETFYRYHGEDNATGKVVTWLTNKKYSNEEELRKELAIRKDWGVKISSVSEVLVPKGQWIVEGPAAAQGEGYPGGGHQVAIQDFRAEWIRTTTKAFE